MRLLAWCLFAATVILFALQWIFLAASAQPMLSSAVLVDQAFPLVGLGAVIGARIGVLITSKYPRNIIGWLFLLGQLGSVAGLAADAFTVLVADGIVDAPLVGQLCSYIKDMFDATYTMTFLAIIFMLAPDGRLLSRRWRVAVAVPIAALLLRLSFLVAQPASDFVPGATVVLGGLSIAILLVDVVALLVALALGAIALLLRLRGSTGRQRIQLQWIASAAAVVATALLLYLLGRFVAGIPLWVLSEGLYLAYIYVWVAVGIAILRYRLYDIDVFLSRAIVLAILGVFITVGYIAVVVLIGAILSATGTSETSLYWPSLVATALVAVAFQPLRRHVLRLADQLVYGRRALPYDALATLSRRLADSPSPDELPATVAEATGRAVGAAWTCVTIEHAGAPATGTGSAWRAGPTAAPGRPGLILPVLDVGERVGTIEVSMPPGRALRNFERRLLEDVAAQAGMAFRNALLQSELAARVAEEHVRSDELAASRQRLVGAEDDARQRLADDIQRRVIPHLAVVATSLQNAADRDVVSPQWLDPLIAATEEAVHELRMVCRGIFPALLERRGLVPALAERLSSVQPGAELIVGDSATARVDPAVEAAGYVFCEEVSSSGPVRSVRLDVDRDRLIVRIVLAGNGQVGGWQHARDRIAALGGEIRFAPSGDGRPDIEVTAWVPLQVQEVEDSPAQDQILSRLSGPKTAFGR